MIYLYAITDQPEAPLPALPGLGESSLFNLVYREIVAVASRLVAPDHASSPPATESNLWQHEAIVEALMDTGGTEHRSTEHRRSVLPVSFGAVLADEAALQAILATRYTGFVTDLKRVSGRVELSVQVLLNDDAGTDHRDAGTDHRDAGTDHRDAGRRPPADCGSHTDSQPPLVSGHAYMLARLEAERQGQVRRQQAEALATDIHAHLDRLADESNRIILSTPHLLLKAAYLVPRERVTDFRLEVDRLCLAYPHLRFLCTGPWPAYSFITPARTANDDAGTDHRDAGTDHRDAGTDHRTITQRLVEALTRASLYSTPCFLSESGNEEAQQEHKDVRG